MPDSISKFKNWTRKGTDEFLSSNNPYSFNVSRNDSIVANFEIATYRITLFINFPEAGTIQTSMDLNNIPAGSYVTLLANAKSGYEFEQWM